MLVFWRFKHVTMSIFRVVYLLLFSTKLYSVNLKLWKMKTKISPNDLQRVKLSKTNKQWTYFREQNFSFYVKQNLSLLLVLETNKRNYQIRLGVI